MKDMKYAAGLLALLFFPAAYAQDGTPLLDLLPPQAHVVFGIHVRAVVDSPLARALTPDLEASMAQWQSFVTLAGFDPLHDLDEVLLASTGEGKNPPLLVVARGKFDLTRLAATAKTYDGVPLVSAGSGPNGMVAILDGTTVLAGDFSQITAAIDRRGSASHLNPAMAARIAEFRGRYDIWGIADQPAGLARRLPDSPPQAQVLDSIDRFQIGVALAHGLEIAAEVHARSFKDADQLAGYLKLFEAMVKASPNRNGTTFTAENQAGTLRISLAVSEEELLRAIQNQRRAMQSLPSAHAEPPPPAPVRIQSADQNAGAATPPGEGDTTVFTLPGPR